MNESSDIRININSKHSFVHLGSLDSFDITEGGKKAGKKILSYLESGNKRRLSEAIHIYEKLIPNENFGGEYTALEWLCRFWIAPLDVQKEYLKIPSVEGFYELLSDNNFDNLKWYLNRKYHFIEIDRKDTESKDRLRFLEDFILFSNPDRIRWEKTEENMAKLPLTPGMHIADVGSGPGYFSFKFCDIVGDSGKVYAIETNEKHLDYLRHYKEKYGINNLEVVTSSFEGIGLSPDIRVDVVYMCSLYHNVYAAFTDEERDAFVGSIRHALNEGGKFIIVDNDMVEDDEIPYHGPHISKELLISQMYYYGFKLEQQFSFTIQRYVLIFTKEAEIPQGSKTHHAEFMPGSKTDIRVTSSSSLVRYRIIGTSTSGYTIRGKKIAMKMYQGLENTDLSLLEEVIDEFMDLYPKERIGSEYTALLWFCQVLTGKKEKESLNDPLYRDYYNYFADNNFAVLKKYIYGKYDGDISVGDDEDGSVHDSNGSGVEKGLLNEWDEYLIFNNPNRYMWEMTYDMIDYLDMKQGEAIADIGCGSGFFTYEFAKRVGNDGVVYATEINPDALAYLKRFTEHSKMNIKPLVSKLNETGLKENSVDSIFMCSMYHAVYIANIEYVRNDFIQSVRKSLKKNGRLIIVDNDITGANAPAYYGPGIAKELIISQLQYYGFELENSKQFVPQRYVLIFRMVSD